MGDSELVKGMLKLIGWVLGAMVLIALWADPDPIGKIREIWAFFRGSEIDDPKSH